MSLRSILLALPLVATRIFAADPPEPKFRAVTIDDKIQIGYGVAVADVDGDGKPDVLLADKKQFVWYRNPTWEKFVLAENLTEKDNVCLAAQDLDGDGKCEIAVGAEWNPSDTEKSGAVFYLIPPADRTQKWTPVKFPSVEPTTHRMKWLKLDGDKWGLVVVPLHGRGNKNGEGAPVKVLCYVKPADPRAEWKAEVIDESMHMTHNFVARFRGEAPPEVILGGKEGITIHARATAPEFLAQFEQPQFFAKNGKHLWQKIAIIPAEAGGAGEVRIGHLVPPTGSEFFATVEPMHGNQLVAYIRDGSRWQRRVLTDQLSDGHALALEDVLRIGRPQIVIGWRAMGKPGIKVGIKLFTPLDLAGEKWRESLIDDNEMACEDLVLADLNADGKLDIVASGRATKNVKIYFNETMR